MNPDLDDIKEYCRDNQADSLFLKSFNDIILQLSDINLKDEKGSTKQPKKGSKEEMISYLKDEVGNEIEFCWRTEWFFLQGQIKAEELGSIINLFNKANII